MAKAGDIIVKKGIKIAFSIVVAAAMAALAYYSLLDRQETATARVYSDGGFVYSGGLRNGLFDGGGEIVLADGARFTGTFRKGRAAGNIDYDAGDWRFEGDFTQGKPNGLIFLPDGVNVRVMPDDTTGFVSPKGWVYTGGIGERGQNGEGTYTFPGGEWYFGNFLLGLADGYGVYRDSVGDFIYQGEWKAGLYHGQGRYTPPGSDFVYEGAFEAGLPHGRVQYMEGETLRYDGDFEGGVPQGQGIYFSPEGWTYEGGFMNGVFHGKGTLTKDGNAVVGTWEKGKQVSREQ